LRFTTKRLSRFQPPVVSEAQEDERLRSPLTSAFVFEGR